MVFCPPFRWSTRGSFNLAGEALPVGEVNPRRETIIIRRDPVIEGDSYASTNGIAGLNHQPDVEIQVQPDIEMVEENRTQTQPVDKSKLIVTPTLSPYNGSSRSSSMSSLTDDNDPRSNSPSQVENGEATTVSDIVQSDRTQKTAGRKDGVNAEAIDTSKPLTDIKYDKYSKDERSIKQIKQAILANDFLRNIMDEERLNAVVEAMGSKEYPSGSLIIKEGENGSHLYVSARGKFDVIKNGAVVKSFEAGIAFGELAILYKAKRFASVVASSDVKVWTLERRVFQKIMVRSGRQENEDNIRFLASVPVLRGIHQIELAKISEFLKREFFAAGTTIVRQGDRGNKFYIIRGGTVMVTKRDNNSERRVNVLMRGDYFGEQALLHEDRRLATCTAQAPGVECLTLDRGPFTDLLGNLKELVKIRHVEEGNSRPSELKKQKSRNTEYDHINLKDLEIVGTLGVGGFGRVELVQYARDRSKTFALKCLKKIDMVQQQQQEHAYNEKHIMMNCSSPFLCSLYKTFKDDKYIYFLMEPVLGGDVWTILQKHRFFNEAITKFMSACVVEAFEYLHNNNMIYRDLKPENLMLDQNGYVKLVDFGFAKEIQTGTKTWTFAGTPEYVAPEIVLNKGHDRAVDYWALGVFIHELLVGKPPFRSQGSDHMKTYTLILKGIDAVQFHPRITKNAQLIIKKLCRPVPGERLGYLKKDIKSHKWYTGFDWEKLRAMKMKAPLVRPVAGNTDLSNFDKYPKEKLPPDETSGWDLNF